MCREDLRASSAVNRHGGTELTCWLVVVAVALIAGTVGMSQAEACTAPITVQIDAIEPDSGLMPGDRITLHGSGFMNLTEDAHVHFDPRLGGPSFGATSPIWIESDVEVYAFVPNEAESGELNIKQWVNYNAGCQQPGGTSIPNNNVGILHLVGAGAPVQIDNQLPNAPHNVEATAVSSSRVDLIWWNVNVAANPPRTGFRIRMSEDFGASWRLVQEINQANATSFTVTGLTPQTVYAFEVAAFGPSGETYSLPNDWGWVTTFGNIAGTGVVRTSATPYFPTPMCAPTPSVQHVEAYFDRIIAGTGQGNGIVEGAVGSTTAGSYPHYFYYQQDPNTQLPNPVRRVGNSASFGRNIAGNVAGNLVIVAYICGPSTPQFVSLHLAIYDDGKGVQTELVRIDAGDRLSYVPERNENGIIMESYLIDMDSVLDTGALLRAQPRAIGNVAGTLVFQDPNQTWRAHIQFAFDAPIATR